MKLALFVPLILCITSCISLGVEPWESDLLAKKITLIKEMEIDFGGIDKEYAVDRAIILAKQLTNSPVLVNLGDDIAVSSSR